jgi:hypothetical protein
VSRACSRAARSATSRCGLHRPLQVTHARRVAHRRLGQPPVSQRVGDHVAGADPRGQLQRPPRPGRRRPEARLEDVLRAQGAVAQGQGVAGPERLKDVKGPQRLGPGGVGVGPEGPHPGRDEQRLAQLQRGGAVRVPDLHRPVGMAGRLAEPVERVQGPGGHPVQPGQLEPVQPPAPLQRQPGEGGGLTVPLGPGRLGRRRGGVAGHRPVGGGDGVVDQPRRLGAGGHQRLQHPPVMLDPPHGRERELDRPPGQLVPEPDPVLGGDQDPAPLGRLQHRQVGQQGLGQPQLGPGRDHGEPLQGRPARARERRDPGPDGVAHRRRDLQAGSGQDLVMRRNGWLSASSRRGS